MGENSFFLSGYALAQVLLVYKAGIYPKERKIL